MTKDVKYANVSEVNQQKKNMSEKITPQNKSKLWTREFTPHHEIDGTLKSEETEQIEEQISDGEIQVMSQNCRTLVYNTDSEEAGWDSPERVRKLVEPYLMPGSKVLDIGIGTGLAVSGYAENGVTVIGLDHDQAMLDIAQSVVGENGSLRRADINGRIPIDDLEDSIDVVQAVGVLEFAKDLPSVFDKVSSCLKNGGVFVFTSELIDGVNTTEHETDYDDVGVTVYRHTPDELADTIEQSGFHLLHTESYDGYERGDSAVPYGLFLVQK